MEKDHGVRFSDETYATKEDVKKALNMSNIDSIWEKVKIYRSYYTRETTLRNVERVPFNVVLPPRLTTKIVTLEKRLSKLLIKYAKDSFQSNKIVKEFENNQYINILKVLASTYEINASEDMLNAIVKETISNVPVEYLVLDHYYKTLKYFKSRYAGQFNISLFMMMYTKLRGIELDVTDFLSYYRKNELILKADHVLIGKHYDAAPVSRINDLMESLFEFNNNSGLFGIVNAVITYFMINYIKPFDYFNEEMSILMAKYVLAHADNEDIASLIPLEELLMSNKAQELKKVMLDSEMRNDYTYILSYIVPLIEEMIDNMDEALTNADSVLIYSEQLKEDEEVIKVNNSYSKPLEINNQSLSYERKVSLPTLPQGLEENDVELVAQNLLELYPTMKKGQALFYARHCTIGKYYTIGQYKKEQNCVYETARTSMDNLVNLGFYKKENIRNKFVYTPVINEDKGE